MWNFLDDLREWYLKILNSYEEDKYSLSYTNDNFGGIKIPFEFVEDIVSGVFGNQEALEELSEELANMKLFNKLLIEKLERLEAKND